MDNLSPIHSRFNQSTTQSSRGLGSHLSYFQPPEPKSPTAIAEAEIRSLSQKVTDWIQQPPSNATLDEIAAQSLRLLSNFWRTIYDDSLGRYHATTRYASEDLIKHALFTLNILDDAMTDPSNQYKSIIANFKVQLIEMQKTPGRPICLADRSFVIPISPLRQPPAAQTQSAHPVSSFSTSTTSSKQDPIEKIQSILQLPHKERAELLESDTDLKGLFYTSFDLMMRKCSRHLASQPQLFSLFSTYFQTIFSLSDFISDPSKDRMTLELEKFLLYYSRFATKETSKAVQSLFAKLFNFSFSDKERVKSLFAAYESFISIHPQKMPIHDRLTILHLINTFPAEAGPSLKEKIEGPLKAQAPTKYTKDIARLNQSRSLGAIFEPDSPSLLTPQTWEKDAQNIIHDEIMDISQYLEHETFDQEAVFSDFFLLYAQIDLLRRSGLINEANQFSAQVVDLSRRIYSHEYTKPLSQRPISALTRTPLNPNL